METDAPRPGGEEARAALESIGGARRRLAGIGPPTWLHWGLGLCMVLEGLAQLLAGSVALVVQALVLVAIFALSFGAQRHSGVIARLARPPARPLAVWISFIALVFGAVLLTNAAARAGYGPLGFFALAALIVGFGPRLQVLWSRRPR